MALRLKDDESKLFVYTSDTDFYEDAASLGKVRRRNILAPETKLFSSLGCSR